MKRLGRIIFSQLLKLLLVLLASVIAFNAAFGQSDALKQSLEESGLYENIAEDMIESAQEENSQTIAGLSLDRPEIKQAAEEALNPTVVRNAVNRFVDGLYGWLDGSTELPEFRIDLSQAKQNFVTSVADQAVERMEDLRPCTNAENFQLSRQEIDPYTVKCRPPVALESVRQRLIDGLNRSEFLKDPVLTFDDLPAETRAQFSDQLKSAPTAFTLAKQLPIILAIFSLLLAGGLILLAESRRRGLRQVGGILLGTGIFLVIASILFNYLFTSSQGPDGQLGKLVIVSGSALHSGILRAISRLYAEFHNTLLLTAGTYALIGGAIIIWFRFTGKSANSADHNTPASVQAENTTTNDSSSVSASTSETEQKNNSRDIGKTKP